MRILATVAGISTLLAVSTACEQRPTSNSSVKIDAGWFVGDGGQSDTAVPGVMWIGNCSSTAVSDTTLVSAGHCVGNDADENGRVNGGHICIQSGAANGTCTQEVYIPPTWASNGDWHQDISVAIFPKGTFKNYFPMRTDAAAAGDNIVMVGYSQDNLDRTDKGTKRWGLNIVDNIDGDEALITKYGGSPYGVAVSPGDSGGPMFEGCRLTGVASRMSEDESGYKISLHTNLTQAMNQQWFAGLRAYGAEFCGMAGAAAESCAASGMAAPISNWTQGTADAQPIFPCADHGDATAQQSIHAGIDLTNAMHVSTNLNADSIKVCVGRNVEACKQTEFSAALERSTASRKIFKLAQLPSLGAQDNYFVLIAVDASGHELTHSIVDIKKH